MNDVIVTVPSILLSHPSRPIESKDIGVVSDKCLHAMKKHGGVGLSAVQIGIPLRLFVMRGMGLDDNDFTMANPEVMETSDETETAVEMCLSMPGLRYEIERAKYITLKYTDANGNDDIAQFDGLRARIIQHEMDHLNGHLFIDHVKMSRLKRDLAMSKAIKAARKRRMK